MAKLYDVRDKGFSKFGPIIKEIKGLKAGSNGLIGKYSDSYALQAGKGTNNEVLSDFAVVCGSRNKVGQNVNNCVIVGDENSIEQGVSNSGILGSSNCTISSGVTNSFIIASDGIEVLSDNQVWIGNVRIDELRGEYYTYVDGGFDTVERINRDYLYTILDGGEDIVYNRFPDTTYHMVDGGNNTTNAV